MESFYFIFAAIALYFVSDWILQRLEIAFGRRFDNRSLIFFALLLALSLISFALIRHFTGS